MPLLVLNSTTLAQRALMAMVVACCPPRLEAPLVNQAQSITPEEDAASTPCPKFVGVNGLNKSRPGTIRSSCLGPAKHDV